MKIPSSQRQPLNKTDGGGGMGEMSEIFFGEIEMGRSAFGVKGRQRNCCLFANLCPNLLLCDLENVVSVLVFSN